MDFSRDVECSTVGRWEIEKMHEEFGNPFYYSFLFICTTKRFPEVPSYGSHLMSSTSMISNTTMNFISALVEERKSTLGRLSSLVPVLRFLPLPDMSCTASAEQH